MGYKHQLVVTLASSMFYYSTLFMLFKTGTSSTQITHLCTTVSSNLENTTIDSEENANSFDITRKSYPPIEFSELIPDPKLYDRMKPPKNEGPTKVAFHVTVMGLDSINEYSMTYAADIFVSQTWKDYRLRLPENMTEEYRLLEVEWLQEMWRPDSFFKNAKQVTFQTMTIPNHYLWLYKDKSILYMVKLTLTLSCSMNFALYPHDTQECKLQIESCLFCACLHITLTLVSHTTDDLVFEWETKVPLVVERIELPQLQLVQNRTEDCMQVYSTGNFTCLEVVFVLKRRLGYYVFHTYIPTCLIVVMSWISFWIAPEAAPARVTLGVTSLLTLSTQHAKSQAGLPPVSYLKAVDVFMSSCTVFVFLALMEYCLVNIVLGDSFEQKKRKRFKQTGNSSFHISMSSFRRKNTITGSHSRRSSPSSFDDPCMMGFTFDEEVPPAPPPPKSRDTARNSLASERRMRALRVDQYSRIIFPFTFTLLNCLYWIIFLEYL